MNAPLKIIILGAILIVSSQILTKPDMIEDMIKPLVGPPIFGYVAVAEAESFESNPVADLFFGEVSQNPETLNLIDKKVEFVRTRRAYPASLAVIKKHEKTIRRKALERGVPEDIALGVGLLENGGSETAVSSAGALGVFQLMPGTARDLGLKVNSKIDERRVPEKNIEAGMKYLAQNYERFGDWGLSTWAYHAGEGNVARALIIYAKANHGLELPGKTDWRALRQYVENHGITIHKLLSDPSVKTFTSRLNDDSHGYPYKVVATAKLFSDSNHEVASTNR